MGVFFVNMCNIFVLLTIIKAITMLIEARYKSLSNEQIEELKFLLSQRGNGAALVRKTGLSIITIKRAAEGKGLTDHVYKTITTTLKKVMP